MITISSGSGTRFLAQTGVDLTGFTVSFLFEPVTPTTADSSGYVIGSGTMETRSATLVAAAVGTVQYTLTASDTATAGRYRGKFSWTDLAGIKRVFPESGFLEWEVQPYSAPSSFSLLSDFREPVRAVMGDFRTPYQYEDAALDSVVRSVVRFGHVTGLGISSNGLAIVPAVTSAENLALVSYWAARTLLRPGIAESSWRTRAMSQRTGAQRDFLFELENLIHNLENPTGITTFQSYYAWINGVAGMNVWGLLSAMRLNAPVATVTIGVGGVQVSTT